MAKLLDALTKAFVKIRRKRISNQIFAASGGTVRHGVFKGLVLDGASNISRGALAPKVLGIYEPTVFAELERHGPYGDAVCIGAADGFYAIGLVKSAWARRAICFEMTESGRAAIALNAQTNGVRDKVIVLGKADETFAGKLSAHDFAGEKALVICDIEGAEFSVLTADVLAALRGAFLVVELHDKLMLDGSEMRRDLIARLPVGYSHWLAKEIPVDWSGIVELENLHDNDRALVVSEGRKIMGEWLFALP